MVVIITAQQLEATIKRLRALATEVEDTARGSSRSTMYSAIALELRDEARKLEGCLR